MPLAPMMRASAIDVRRLFHRLALRRTILPFRHHAATNRMRTLLRFSHFRITSPPFISALPIPANTVTYAGTPQRSNTLWSPAVYPDKGRTLPPLLPADTQTISHAAKTSTSPPPEIPTPHPTPSCTLIPTPCIQPCIPYENRPLRR